MYCALMSRERLDALEQEIRDLRIELAATRAGQVRSMRDAHRCPACGHTEILHVPTVREAADAGTLRDLAITHEKNFWQHSIPSATVGAYACGACGLIEWHVKEPGKLVPDGTSLLQLSAGAPSNVGPYR